MNFDSDTGIVVAIRRLPRKGRRRLQSYAGRVLSKGATDGLVRSKDVLGVLSLPVLAPAAAS